jgi:hypothetical protein
MHRQKKQSNADDSEWSPYLTALLGQDETKHAIACLDRATHRRLSHKPETTVPLSKLCQMVHISPAAGEKRPVLRGARETYYVHSMDSALREIDECRELGIERFYLQLAPDADPTPIQRIVAFARVIEEIRSRHRHGVRLVADPQALCMGRIFDGASDARTDRSTPLRSWS